MGCFNHYTESHKIILFGGGAGQALSSKGFCIDLKEETIGKFSNLDKPDRFQNHLYFKKDEKLYVFGEFYMHILNLAKEKWIKDPIPLNQNAIANS